MPAPNTPAEPWGAFVAHFPHDGGLPHIDVGSASASCRFEAHSAFTRVLACLLAELSFWQSFYIEGLSRFVTSSTAPTTTGWSNLAGRELHPLKIAIFSRRASNSNSPLLTGEGQG